MRRGTDALEEARARMAAEMARLETQGEKIVASSGMTDAGGPDEEADALEVWARRIGRGLGYLFALYLIWRLFSVYVVG